MFSHLFVENDRFILYLQSFRKEKIGGSVFFKADLVESVEVCLDSAADDVGGNALSRIKLAGCRAKLDDGCTDGFLALGECLNAEIVEVIVMTDYLLDGAESGVDGAVTRGEARKNLAVFGKLDVSGGGYNVAVVDNKTLETVGGRNLKRHCRDDGIQLVHADVFFAATFLNSS